MFSEPGAGSDLAGVSARAVRDGDDWILSGQKVWTSMAHLADVGEALVRTDPEAPKHAGLTMFVVDMHAPGVTVRPIRQMTGGSAFNEVFLDEVRVPDTNRIGDVGEGWRVASTSLGSERSTMSGATGPVTPYVLEPPPTNRTYRHRAHRVAIGGRTVRGLLVAPARPVLRFDPENADDPRRRRDRCARGERPG